MVLTYFQTYFAYFHLLQACWQPSCSTVDFCFNAARLKPELLSCDGVIDWCNCTTNDSNVLYYCSRADPFWVILEFHLAWVLAYCLGPKKWEFENFFEIGPHLHAAHGAFLDCAPKNILILIEIEPLVLDIQCCYSYVMLFREEDIYDHEHCIRVS